MIILQILGKKIIDCNLFIHKMSREKKNILTLHFSSLIVNSHSILGSRYKTKSSINYIALQADPAFDTLNIIIPIN